MRNDGRRRGLGGGLLLAALVAGLCRPAFAGEEEALRERVAGLEAALARQSDLAGRVGELEAENERLRGRVDELEARDRLPELDDSLAGALERYEAPTSPIRVSGMLATRFAVSGRDGAARNGAFSVPEARLFLDITVADGVYAFFEIETETHGLRSFRTGEMYVTVEDLVPGATGLLTLKAGRFDLPFGEEYLERDADRNPLITHSVADVWGLDEGIEAFGRAGPVGYVVAVTNGGTGNHLDAAPGKAFHGKLFADFAPWLYGSLSFTDSGSTAWPREETALYVSDVWGRPLGEDPTHFRVRGAEADAKLSLDPLRLRGAFGALELDDADPAPGRDVRMHWVVVEAVADLAESLYAAARYSRIETDRGTWFLGAGSPVAEDDPGGIRVERLSIGFGWQFAPHAVLKAEVARVRGRSTRGVRDGEDLFAVELVVGF